MAGLLDFFSTPQGQGLLSGVASYAMNARRGTPINNLGRGLAGGVTGYSGALDQQRQDANTAIADKYRSMQMQEIEQKIAASKAQDQWRAGLPAALAQTKDQADPYQADNPFGQDLGNLQTVSQVPDTQAQQNYLMQPGSPYADKIMEQRLFPKPEDYKVVGDSLVQIGQQGVKPVYTAPAKEAYKERTVSPDGVNYIKQASTDGGVTWKQIEGTQPYSIRGASGSSTTSVTNNISTGTEKKYGEKFAEAAAGQDLSAYDAAQKAPELASRSNRIKQVISTGKVITGFGAEPRLALGKALGLVGASDAETIANTEALSADLSKNTLDAIKASGLGSGNGFSNADRDFLEKAAGGKITLEASTLSRLAELSHRAATASATKWNTRAKTIPQSALEGTGITRDPVMVPPLFSQQAKPIPTKAPVGVDPKVWAHMTPQERALWK